MAEIMSTFFYQRLVDLYNDIPYSTKHYEAGTNNFPKYDRAQTVYNSLVRQA